MSFLDSDVVAVYTSGRAVAGYSESAGVLAGVFLRSLESASDVVLHPVVTGGIDRFHATWQPLVNEVALEVDALGSNTGHSATVVAHSDLDANGLLSGQAAAGAAQGTDLVQRINRF